jgi:hypothetical protein
LGWLQKDWPWFQKTIRILLEWKGDRFDGSYGMNNGEQWRIGLG